MSKPVPSNYVQVERAVWSCAYDHVFERFYAVSSMPDYCPRCERCNAPTEAVFPAAYETVDVLREMAEALPDWPQRLALNPAAAYHGEMVLRAGGSRRSLQRTVAAPGSRPHSAALRLRAEELGRNVPGLRKANED